MMDRLTSNAELQQLGGQLERFLRESNVPLVVRCGQQGDRLIIVGHHASDVRLDPLHVLQSIQATLRHVHLTFTRRIRLYLRKVGHTLPYARCYFTLEEIAQRSMVEDGSPLQLTAWLEDLPPVLETGTSPQPEAMREWGLLRPDIDVVEWFQDAPRTIGGQSFDQYLAVTGSMAVAGLALSGFVIRHPCVSGICPELGAAESLGQRSFTQMQEAETVAQVAQAQDYLEGAVDLLDAIPRWSPRSSEARTLLQGYQPHSASLQRAIAAANAAELAQERSRLPEADLKAWAEAQMLWQEAIAQLQAIPEDSPLNRFADIQLETYRAQLAVVQDQRSQEVDGQEHLNHAKRYIQMAQIFHAKAETPEDWEQVWANWNIAIEQLREISPTTRAGIEAARLLEAYGDIPTQLGDRLQAGILATPELPPEPQVAPVIQTPIDWTDLEQEIPIPPPPEIVETGQALPEF
ncbi:MAG: hypothetical protein AAFY26_12135 [Cyanobacteria bacterium J06638_22]